MSKAKIAVTNYTQSLNTEIRFTLLHKNRPNVEDLNHVEEFTKNFLDNK